jgi:choline kinase
MTANGTRAIVLAAGRGSRLGPRAADGPKCMVELSGRPLLHRQIEVLHECGVHDVTIVTGYNAAKIDAPGCRLRHNPAFATTNMVESLFAAEDLFGEDLVVSYGDILYAPFVLHALLRASGEILVVVDVGWREYWMRRFDDPLEDAETLRMDGQGRLVSLGARARSLDEIEGQYIGLVRYHGAGVEHMRAAYHACRADSSCRESAWSSGRPLARVFMTDLLDHLCRTTDVRAVCVQRQWIEVDTIDDLALAERELTGLRLA